MKTAKSMTKKDINKMAKVLIAFKDQPSIDVQLTDDMWKYIQKSSKILRDINKNIQKYQKNPEVYFNDSRFTNYEEYKKVMIKNLSQVCQYCEYLGDKIRKVSGKL